MNTTTLAGKTVACLATHGFEQAERTTPVKALKERDATVLFVAPEQGTIRAWHRTNSGKEIQVERTIDQAITHADEYDALLLPGGVMNPDKLRMREDATAFVRAFFKAGKPVSAICRGPQVLIDAVTVAACNALSNCTNALADTPMDQSIKASAEELQQQPA